MRKTTIKISFLSPFNEFTEEPEFSLDFYNGATISDMINKLIEKFGDKFKEILLDKEGNISDEAVILKDGNNIFLNSENALEDSLIENQEYVFITFMEMG